LISQAVAKAGIRVALSGLGGDELFAGYDSFGVVERFEYAPYQALAQVASLLLMVTRPGWQRTEKLRALVTGAGSRIERYSILRQVMSTDLRHALLGANSHNDIITLPAGRVAELMRETQNCDAINSQSCFELSAYVGDMLLRDADQMSMVHPVEIRVPLLDHVLIETLAAIPGKLKLHGPSRHVSKQLLIDALPTRLPPSITQRPKMGFVFPWELWLRKELAEHVTWILTDWKALHDTGLDELEVQRLWKDFRRGQAGIRYTDILALIHLLHWARRHRLSI
jgi:asparagine synthase (glutamine-hydrolysing)